MLLDYNIFYKRYGVRIVDHLITPPLPKLDLLDLPKNSILHFAPDSPLIHGPDPQDFLFRHITKPILVNHILQIPELHGNPRHVAINPLVLVNKFHTNNRRFKKLTHLEAGLRDEQTLIICNYGLLRTMYQYPRSIYSEYYKWLNSEIAIIEDIKNISKTTNRQHFILNRLPVILPSVNNLRNGSEHLNQTTVKIFNSPESLIILELWKWLGSHRETSILSRIPDVSLKYVNFIFQESGRWFTVNLGKLNSWRTPTDEELMERPEFKDSPLSQEELKKEFSKLKMKGIAPSEFQKRFLRMLMSLHQVRSVAAPEVTESANDNTLGKNKTVQENQDKTTPTPIVIVQKQTKTEEKTVPEDVNYRATRIDRADDTVDDIVHSPELNEQIDKDLAELEVISEKHHAKLSEQNGSTPSIVEEQLYELPTLEEGVMNVCDRLADMGSMSAAEYRRYQQLSSAYKTIMAPGGTMTLDKFVQIPPEKLKIESSIAINDIPTVIDKTMLKSSLHEFDTRYIKEIMHRDIASMVVNVQHAGIAVTDYEVEHVDSILGSYDSHTVRVTPVNGSASTLRFKLPHLEEDGTYQANGVKYRLRKQRGDLPIRKIGPDRVALTSYYGKVFISRSIKRVNDYGQWLRNAIMAKGLDSEDRSVTSLHPGDVFDNLFSSPKLYSALSMGFRGFVLTTPYHDKKKTLVNPIKPVSAPIAQKPSQQDRVNHASVMMDRSKVEKPTSPQPAPKYDGDVARPMPLNLISFALNFDHTKRKTLFGEKAMRLYEKDGAIIVGRKYVGEHGIQDETDPYLVMDFNGHFYIGSKGHLEDLGTIEQLLDLDAEKAPVDFAEIKVLGRTIPIGVVLGYELGLDKLMRSLGVEPRRVPAGTRLNLEVNEYPIVFSDETLIFNREDRKASIILAGFNEYHKAIRQYSVYEFDRRAIYLNILETQGNSARYLREIDLLYQMFIDPITRDLLIEMKEPLNFHGLLIRSCELLLTDQHPDELDAKQMRIKGYERMAGAVYSEITRAIRSHAGRVGRSKMPIDLNPYAVWKNIMQDPSAAQVVDQNPIQNLKEQEAVTYAGVGGRSSRTMSKGSRIYHENDMGTISESTSDSSDVAINTYTSADPQFTSLRGMSKPYVIGKTGATALLSTSALISVGADRDDPKRTNFIGIQHSHGIACSGYRQSPVRTGYEQVIAHRTSDLFAKTAKKSGTVVSISDHGIIVQYEGEDKPTGYEIGRRFGNAAGLVIPHEVVTEMTVGQEFKPGDVICYNTGFFEKDLLNPSNIVWKAGIMVKTALLESTDTLEDSSAISIRAAELLKTKTTKVKTVVVNFDQSIRRMVTVGEEVESENILCVIEDAITANAGLFDEESLDTLRILTSQTPQSKAKGIVERIEVFYHGEKEDMSESLRAIASTYDRDMSKRYRAIGKQGYNGSVDDSFRVEGDPLALDTMAVRFYITRDVPAGVGDKGVFANQMKTVFGRIISTEIKTESGKVVDAIFGAKSIGDRIVNSPDIIGTTATLLDIIGKKAVAAYRS